MGAAAAPLSLDDQLTAYGQYHVNHWNRAVHILCVPLGFWSAMVLLAHAPVVFVADAWPLNASFCATFGLVCYYGLLEPLAALMLAPLAAAVTYSANVFAIKAPHSALLALPVHAAAWAGIVVSHALLEQRRVPARPSALLRAALIAPLFVFFDLLFVLGYRPGLQRRLYERARAAVTTLRLRDERRSVHES